MNKSKKTYGGSQPRRRRKAGRLAAFPDLQNRFWVFCWFCDKKEIKSLTIK